MCQTLFQTGFLAAVHLSRASIYNPCICYKIRQNELLSDSDFYEEIVCRYLTYSDVSSKHLIIFSRNSLTYTQSPIIRTGRIRPSAEFSVNFKNQPLGGSNLRTTSKKLRTASAQIFKAKNQFVDDSIVDGPQKRSI